MELEERENHIYCKDYEHMKTASNKGHISDSEQRNLYDTIKTELKEYGMRIVKIHILLLKTNCNRRREPHSIQHPIVQGLG
jgi:hypothetical protein